MDCQDPRRNTNPLLRASPLDGPAEVRSWVNKTHPLVRVLENNIFSNDRADVTGHYLRAQGGGLCISRFVCFCVARPEILKRTYSTTAGSTNLHYRGSFSPCSTRQERECKGRERSKSKIRSHHLTPHQKCFLRSIHYPLTSTHGAPDSLVRACT